MKIDRPAFFVVGLSFVVSASVIVGLLLFAWISTIQSLSSGPTIGQAFVALFAYIVLLFIGTLLLSKSLDSEVKKVWPHGS
jgi:hypothetical protein